MPQTARPGCWLVVSTHAPQTHVADLLRIRGVRQTCMMNMVVAVVGPSEYNVLDAQTLAP